MAQKFRITYATLSADNEDLQRAYDEAAERVKSELGQAYPVIVNGEERWRDERYDEPSPIDKDLLIGSFSQATVQDVEDAVAAAKDFQLTWDRMGWQERIRIVRAVADVMEERLFDLAAMMAYEVGKSRLEALGDVAGDRRAHAVELRRDRKARRLPGADERVGRRRATTTTCCAPTASGRSSARSTSRWPCPAVPPAAPSWPATPWC